MNANYVPRGHTRHEVLTAAMSSTAPNASSMAKPPRITNKVGTQEGIRFGGGWPGEPVSFREALYGITG